MMKMPKAGQLTSAIGFDVKKMWFNQSDVIKKMSKKRRTFLTRYGAFVRTKARSLLNKSGGKKNVSSHAGGIPRKHQGNLRRFLFFAYSSKSESVVVGPIVLRGTKGLNVPEVLEHGGIGVVTKMVKQKNQRRRRKTVVRRVRIDARPYMSPAFEMTTKEKTKISAAWK